MKVFKAIGVAVAGAALLLVSGCGFAPFSRVPPTATSAVVTPSATQTTTAPPVVAAPPAGYTMTTAAANKVEVPLPDGLQMLDPSQIDISPDAEQMFADMAQKLGMTTDALKQEINGLDLFAMDDSNNNINIMQPLPATGATLAQVQPSLENLGATGITSRNATSPLGPVLVVAYTLTENNVTMNQTQLYAQTDTMTTTVITITGVTWTADDVSQIADIMIAGISHV